AALVQGDSVDRNPCNQSDNWFENAARIGPTAVSPPRKREVRRVRPLFPFDAYHLEPVRYRALECNGGGGSFGDPQPKDARCAGGRKDPDASKHDLESRLIDPRGHAIDDLLARCFVDLADERERQVQMFWAY